VADHTAAAVILGAGGGGEGLVVGVVEVAEIVGEHHVVEGSGNVRLGVIDDGRRCLQAGCGSPTTQEHKRHCCIE
jgi:hypothetical protein